MKTSYMLMALFVLCAAAARGDASRYEHFLKERERVLSQIVAELENRLSSGKANDEEVFSAQLNLHSFRRDAAKSKVQKVVHQKMIVAVCEGRLTALRSRVQIGAGDSLQLLRTTDNMLHALQLLEELQLNAK